MIVNLAELPLCYVLYCTYVSSFDLPEVTVMGSGSEPQQLLQVGANLNYIINFAI